MCALYAPAGPQEVAREIQRQLDENTQLSTADRHDLIRKLGVVSERLQALGARLQAQQDGGGA